MLAEVPHRLSLYVLGLMTFTGALAGRFICGWLCPFGLLQELVARVHHRKFPLPKVLTRLKYLFLILALALPVLILQVGGTGEPYFCKFICPAGTIEAGLPLGLGRPELRGLLGGLFLWKAAILVLFLVAMVFLYRPFCQLACPLGTFYGLCNRFSLWRLEVAAGCEHCGQCRQSCPLKIPVDLSPNSAECIRCLLCRDACPRGLISFDRCASVSNHGSTHEMFD
ncbi:MAG: 4Fe-4S binding protein [Thermacetogeniaceae bacterium]